MNAPRSLAPLVIGLGVMGVVVWTAIRPFLPDDAALAHPAVPPAQADSTVQEIDAWFARRWHDEKVEPAQTEDELLVLRRISLALTGAIPSLEEIREFKADERTDRLRHWTSRWIADSRFLEYFPSRFVDGLVDPLASDVKPYHLHRLQRWLGDQIQQGQPYDGMVRKLVADRGLWGDHPATTFTAVELRSGDAAAERLAARTVRFFLGQRIDCAQCHDHPFEHWTQQQFEGLAAYYGHVRFTAFGVQDQGRGPLRVEDPRTQETREVDPLAPFNPEWSSSESSVREQLAVWLTHAENQRFRRAIANRVWGLMFGRPLVSPVDDLPDPPPAGRPDDTYILDLLGNDLAAHRYDLRRLIMVIAQSRPFRLSSSHPQLDEHGSAERVEEAWAVFPLSQLRPKQVIRSMQQAASVQSLRREDSSAYASIRRHERTHHFVESSGAVDLPDDDEGVSTIPQTIERLVGRSTREFSEATMLTAPGRIAAMSGSNEECLENCYLACLTRRPTSAERAHFLERFGSGGLNRRTNVVEDIYWTLFNSAEFSWNH